MRQKGKIILVTGGSGSGKSSFSENLLKNEKNIFYIATTIVKDEETERKVESHKKRRDKRYKTYEGFENLGEIIKDRKEEAVLLDCVSSLITNYMFKESKDYDFIPLDEVEKIKKDIEDEVINLIKSCKEENKFLVMVTNEVGCSLAPEFKVNRVFRNIIGMVNQVIASLSDEVYLVSCGLPLKLK